jgi:hypothetical protein
MSTDQTATYRRIRPGEAATHNHVVLDDGSEFVVRVGNRDLIAWDRSSASKRYDRDRQTFVFANFLAWNAARREGFFADPFDAAGGFLDRAEEVTPLRLADDDGSADGEYGAARPTRTAAPPA